MFLYVPIKSAFCFINVSTDIANTSITFYTMAIGGLMSKLQRLFIIVELEPAGITLLVLRHGSHSHRLL